MKNLGVFLTAFMMVFASNSVVIAGSEAQFENLINSGVPIDLTELVKLILSTLGGVLATIVLTFLKNKFPDLFKSAKDKKIKELIDEAKKNQK